MGLVRGVVTSYLYNNRHLPTNINYNVSGDPTGSVGTQPVSFVYDAAGNRTSMTDGLGSVGYGYDTLSRLTSETRYFSALKQSFTLNYGYNYANELTGISNPWGAWVGYTYDDNGRLTRMNGDGSWSANTYAYDIKYRAFGGVKSMTFGDHQSLSTSYDNRMRPSSVNVSNVLGYNYSY